ncbi:hypothetical protein EYD45_03305 [Hyunsoonleella flava]|uniref:STAS domain-containing protein n=1 Tax=Hyunsoonleella flava TaxID=2527939 RepID=A0A4Q9FFG0_9FLAO|nr:STAS domain-containing protein [Hyunsoonleella flava]TBN05317.1 hypothetical protein EYD45_03305 [Hyunsoonleella flava]
MDLKIISCNNFFKLKGELNEKNVALFKTEFQEALENFNMLTISVEELKKVDNTGVNAFLELQSQSVKNDIQLSIVGNGCEALFHSFKTTDVAVA